MALPKASSARPPADEAPSNDDSGARRKIMALGANLKMMGNNTIGAMKDTDATRIVAISASGFAGHC